MLAAISPTGLAIGATDPANGTDTALALARMKAAAGLETLDEPAAAFKSMLESADASLPASGDSAAAGKAESPYQKFEAMVLSQLVSAMMNAGGENVFGDGTAMSAYTSLFSQAIGDEVARRGGIGIADALARSQSR